MKNNLFKKSMSVFLAVLMIMSCWVWTPGIAEHNHAEAVASNVRGVPAIRGSHYAGTTAAYGTPVFDGNLDRWFKFHNKGSDYVQIYYPSNIYLDKSETLQSAGYFFNVNWAFGNSSDYRILIGAPALGDNSAYTGYPDKYYTMTNCFTGYGFDSSVPTGGRKIVYNTSTGGTDYDLRIVGYGHSTQGSDGFSYDGTRHDKYVLYRSYSGNPNTATIYLMGTPKGEYDKKEYNTTGGSLGSYGFQQNYNGGWKENNNSMFKQKSYDQANDGCSNYYEGQYAEMQWFVTVYDKSALNAVITNANSLLTQKGKYTTASLNNLQNVLNANKGVLTTRATNQKSINDAKDNIQAAIDNLVEFGVAFDNLFNFNEYVIAGDLTVNERTDKGFTVTSTAADGNTGFSKAIPVEPGKTYILSADVGITAVSGGYDMYIHTLDANQASETTAVPDTSNGAHREGDVYISLTGQTTNSTPYIRFTAGSNTKFVKIRFDANTPGNKLTVNNIRLLNETDYEGVSYVPTKMFKNNASLGTSFTVPTRTGYTFNRWYTDNNSDGKYTAGEEVTDANGSIVSALSTYKIDQNWMLHSDWTEHKYNIAFNANGGSGLTAGINNVLYSADTKLTANGFSRTGHIFTGWNTKADGTGTAIADGATVSKLTATDGATVTLYAQWSINKHTVTFEKIDGTTDSKQYEYGTEASEITKPANTASGYDANEHFKYSWPTIANVTGNVTYKEEKTSEAHSFTTHTDKDDTYHTDKCSCGYSKDVVHSYDNGVQTSAPGCTTEGVKTYTCSVCNGTKTEAISSTGHIPAVAVRENENPATCEAEGSYDEVVYCSVCKAEISRTKKTIEKLAHTEVIIPAVESTCTATGLTEGKQCSVCGEILVAQQTTEMKPHTEEIIPAEESTCTATGLTEGKKCSVCGTITVAQQTTNKKAHEMGDWEEVLAPTCITEGKNQKKCNNCSYTEEEAIPATGIHVYGEWYIDGDNHTRVCKSDSNCGKTESEAHNFSADPQPKSDADSFHDYKCTVCNERGAMLNGVPHRGAGESCFIDDITFSAIEGNDAKHIATCKCGREKEEAHTFGAWFADPENKADNQGKMSRICSGCNYKITSDCIYIVTETLESSCTVKGYKTYVCSECGNGYSEILALKAHTPSEPVEENRTESTCTVAGSYESVIKCSECSEELSRTKVDLELAEHTIVTDKAVEPTCTTTGLTEGKHCSVCNEILLKQNTVDALGHTFGETVEAKTETCTEDGNKAYKQCTACDLYFAENAGKDSEDGKKDTTSFVISKLGHEYEENFTVDKKASCTEAGSKSKHCSRCDDKTEVTEIPVREHTVVDVDIQTDATCLTNGVMNQKCSNTETDEYEACEYTTTRVIPAKGHTFGETVEAKTETCTEDGNKAYKQCTACDLYFAENAGKDSEDGKKDTTSFVISKLGHKMELTSAQVDPTCTATGTKAVYTCANGCGRKSGGKEIPALGHIWTVSYSFADDGSSCTAERVCSRDESHVETATATINSEVTIQATCTEKGTTTYTATFGVDWAKDQTQDVVDLPAINHDYDRTKSEENLTRPVLTDGVWSQGYYTYTCKNDASHKEKEFVDRASYTEYEAALENLKNLLDTDLTDEARVAVNKAIEDNEIADNLIASEQEIINNATQELIDAFNNNNSSLKTYNVTFKIDGSKDVVVNVISGSSATAPTDVKKAYDDTYHYEFAGWDKTFTSVKSDLTVTAQFDAVEHSFTTHTDKDDTYHTDKCNCGYSKDVEHTETSAVTKKATCEADGVRTYTCSVCNGTRTETIAKRAHVYKDNGVKTPATCMAEGVMNTICTNEETETHEACKHESTRVIPVDVNAHKYMAATYSWTQTADGKWNCTAVSICEYNSEHTLTAIATAKSAVKNPATCEEMGTTTYTATFKGIGWAETQTKDVVDIPALGHTEGEAVIENNVDPDCVNDGSYDTVVYCTVCDEELSRVETTVPALGHEWNEATYSYSWSKNDDNEWVCTAERKCQRIDCSYSEDATATITSEVTTKATCEEMGITTYTASFDVTWAKTQTQDVVDIPALGHSFTNYKSNEDATCQNNGTETAKCDRCDATDTREIADSTVGHKFESYVANKDATCQKNETETAECAFGCGEKDTREISDSTVGHKFEKYVANGDATCQKNETETAECAFGCGETDTREIADSTVDHKFESYVANGDATCQKNETETAECAFGCGEKDTREIADSTVGHKFTVYTSDNNAECEKDGTKTAVCDYGCGNKDTVTDTGSALDHDWKEATYSFAEDGSSCTATRVCGRDASHVETATATMITSAVKTEATCKEMGTTTYTASFGVTWAEAQTKDVKDIPLADHIYKDATCDKPSTCTVCGVTSGTAVGHLWSDTTYNWFETKEGWNCTAERVCQRTQCGVKTTATVAAELEITKQATCEEKGVATYTANFVSSWTEVQTKTVEIDALGHDYKVTKSVSPNCESAGYKLYTCQNDSGHSYKEVIKATGHKYGDWVVVKDATCTTGEVRHRTCSACGGYEEKVGTQTRPHVISYEPGREATCLVEGYTAFETCYNCDYHTQSVVIEKLPHEDKDGDGECDRCEGIMTSDGACNCICHKRENKFLNFIYKILRFFWKLFKIQKSCLCGNEHY